MLERRGRARSVVVGSLAALLLGAGPAQAPAAQAAPAEKLDRSGRAEAADAAGYVLRELPLLPGSTSGRVNAVNDRGAAVGFQSRGGDAKIPVKWRDGRVRRLELPRGAVSGEASDISSRGVVVGTVTLRSGPLVPVAWVRGEPRRLATPPAEGEGLPLTYAYAISDTGLVVGSTWTSGVQRPIYWQAPRAGADYGWRDLDGSGWAVDVNDAGLAVVLDYTSDGLRAMRGQVGGALTELPAAADALEVRATGVNAAGTIVGYEWVDREDRTYQGVSWVDGERREVPLQFALAVNDGGAVAGVTDDGVPAVLTDGEVVELPGDGAPLDINENGLVAGNAQAGPRLWVPQTDSGS